MRDPEDLNNLVIRYIQNGVVLSLDHAKEIYAWLGTKINEAQEIEQQRLKGK